MIYGVLHLIFLLSNGSTRVRNSLFYTFAFPGTFAFASGWIGFVFPVPAIIGAPAWALLRQTKEATWMPAPFLNVRLGFEGPRDVVTAFFIGEIGLLVAWITCVVIVHRVTCRKASQRATPAAPEVDER